MLLIFGLTLTAPSGLAADGRLLKAMEEEIVALVEKNRSCVVSIHTTATRQIDFGQNASGVGMTILRNVGSGVIFDAQGYILTTTEVVRGADHIQVSLSSGRTMDADLVAMDEDSKVAVVRLRGKVPRCPRFGDSDSIRTGHYAFILGNAYGTMSPSVGTVVEFHDDDDLIQISGAARPGNSGAAVFNSEGQVIGIVRGILAPSSHEETSSPDRTDEAGWSASSATLLAIPINRAQEIARRLISGGWLGVEVECRRIRTISRVEAGEPADGTGLAAAQIEKLRISRVEAGGPADRAGLQPGDVIVSYNGAKIIDGAHLERLVMETPAGSQVQIGLLRDEQMRSVQVRVGQRSEQVPQKAPLLPPTAYGPARHGAETPEMLLQRLRDLDPQTLRDLQVQMQMLIQQQEGKKDSK